MISQEEILTRNKIIGVLLRSARLRAEVDVEECAQVLSSDSALVVRAEEGETELTLPQLESLARVLQVPLGYLLGEEELPEDEQTLESLPFDDIMTIRRKIIGVILRQARLESGRTLDDVAPAMGYTPEYLARVELGQAKIPVVELGALARALGVPFDRFIARDIIAATPEERNKSDLQRLAHLPPQVREFVLQSINVPYLQVAINLSQMPAETLRQIATDLLEITY